MNWLDILLLLLAGIGFVKGLFDGVIKQVVLLIALWVGIFCCAKVAVWLHVPSCTSNELFKNVLDDRSVGAFSGRILVKEGAEKTEAYQANRNLCATREAHMKCVLLFRMADYFWKMSMIRHP